MEHNLVSYESEFVENYNVSQQARNYADEVVKGELIYY